mmetsp:Transcript_10295/g.26981  ORF Transcript_10295/g.26981 Transcript_10295/m.26981 type:complete len:396 (-) Transcript_10295:164-1351(-)
MYCTTNTACIAAASLFIFTCLCPFICAELLVDQQTVQQDMLRASIRGISMSAAKVIKSKEALGFPWATQDPFLFCVFHEDKYPKGDGDNGPKDTMVGRNMGMDFTKKNGYRMYHGQHVPGFPSHPHRGFETVTVVNKGFVDHADSIKGAARYGLGDVQWLTAGKGIQHSEMFPCVHTEKDNPLELFQIWLNLPAKDKMVAPHFKMLWKHEIPDIVSKNDKGKESIFKLIAGKINGLDQSPPSPPPNSWASKQESDVMIGTLQMEKDASFVLKGSEVAGSNRTLYFFEGQKALVNGNEIEVDYLYHLKSDVDLQIENSGEKPLRFLFLQGKPIGEPVVQHGPFVMNKREEIRKAFEDYQRTEFGGWPWDSSAPTHGGAEQGRFAKHPQGKREKPPQ